MSIPDAYEMLVRGLGKEIMFFREKTTCVCMFVGVYGCACVTHKRSRRKEYGRVRVIVFKLFNSCHRERNSVLFSKQLHML